MTLPDFFREWLSFSVLFPAALLCILPMKNQLRFSLKTTLLLLLGTISLASLGAAWISLQLDSDKNAVLFPILILLFVLYRLCLKAELYQCVSVFLLSCVIMGFMSNFANGFDARRNPVETPEFFSAEAALFQLGISLASVALLAYPMQRFGSRMIDEIPFPRIWNSLSVISALFLFYNILIIPRNYKTLYVGRLFQIFWFTCGMLLVLLLLIYVIFYLIATGILNGAKREARLRLLEMQERQYSAQQRYLEETAALRHDFKHSLVTIKSLADTKEYAALTEYLDGYMKALPVNELRSFSTNHAVNALLNYYYAMGREKKIRLHWQIELPEKLPFLDSELCGILGNILENAVAGCMTLAEDERYLQLSLMTQHDTYLYIVATNSFSGRVVQQGARYISTKRAGGGLGLSSIASTVEKLGGNVRFYHKDREFYTDIMLPMHRHAAQ